MPIVKHTYDHIFSLGYNCETSFQLQYYYKFVDSGVFSWIYAWSLADSISALENFEDIAKSGFEEPNPLYECKNTHLRFHGRVNMSQVTELDVEQRKNEREELLSRISYLKEKFKKTGRDGKRNLYIIKVRSNEENLLDNLKALYFNLQTLVSNEFDVLAVVDKPVEGIDNPSPHIYIRCVQRFTPEENVVAMKLGDPIGWQKILDEFVLSLETVRKYWKQLSVRERLIRRAKKVYFSLRKRF